MSSSSSSALPSPPSPSFIRPSSPRPPPSSPSTDSDSDPDLHYVRRLSNPGDISGSHPSPRYLYLLTFLSAIGGFLFGYDTGVVSGAMILIRKVKINVTCPDHIILKGLFFCAGL
jgi:hypothetical protein